MNDKIKLKITRDVLIEAKDTDTFGSHAFLVAALCGGVMEDPEFHYEDYQIIHANSKEEAERIYNELNRCSYYYAKVIGRVYDGAII